VVDIRLLTQTAIGLVATLAPQAVQTFVYRSLGSTSYNATTDATTASFGSVNVTAPFVDFEAKDIDGVEVIATDKKALIAASDISGVTPKKRDKLDLADATWFVQDVKTDPATALWMLHIRRA
jgi:hypothetical protein